MKKVLTITIFLVFQLTFSQDLSGIVTYQTNIVESYIKEKVKMPEHLKYLEIKSGKDAVPINFELYFKKGKSLYKAENDYITSKRKGLLMNETNLVSQSGIIFYVDTKTNEKLFKNHSTNNIVVKFDDIDWILHKETKIIEGYICHKATTVVNPKKAFDNGYTGNIEAWYTPDIPVPFGIQSFVGLPGLTLELTADLKKAKIHYSVTKIELNPENEIKIEKPIGKQILSEQEYSDYIKELNARR